MSTRPLSFCMITTFYPPYNFGGDGIFVQRLANELAQRGHHVEIVHCTDAYRALESQARSDETSEHPNVVVHRLASRVGHLSPFITQQTGHPFFKRAQLEKILARNFDVIHFHNISLVGGPKILEYGRGIKLYTMHEYWLMCPMHLLLRANGEVCTKRECFRCTLEHKRPPQWWRYSALLEKSLQHLDAVITPSQFSQAQYAALNTTIPAQHIPNFVSDQEIAATRSESRAPYFLFVGRLEKIKGLQTILSVFRERTNAQLLVAGTGSYEMELRRLARNSPNIQFLGQQSFAQLKPLYRNACAVILPSLWYEVFPLVALEAFQQQTPLLARNLGALREIVETSGGGWTYDTDAELETLLDGVLQNPAERAARGANGYAMYRREWTADAHLKRYFELLEHIASQHRAARFV